MSIRILFLLCTLATLAALHILFIQFRLYDTIAWLDIPIHLYGGAIIGLGLCALSDFRMQNIRLRTFIAHLQETNSAVLLLITVVVAWEVFGYLFLGSSLRPDYLSDTMVDIVAGLGGGVIGLYVGRALAVLNE